MWTVAVEPTTARVGAQRPAAEREHASDAPEKHMPERRAFTLADLAFALATCAIAAALVIAASADLRKQRQLASAQSNLRWIAGITSSYAADFDDRLWGFSWQAGILPDSTPGLPTIAATGKAAIRTQMLDILWRRGRPDMTVSSVLYAGAFYSHLPLLDYLDRDAPDLAFVSPGDKHRLNWTKNPQELHDTGFWLPYQEEPTPDNRRWPYSASFLTPAHMISQPVSGPDAIHHHGGFHSGHTVPDGAEFRGVQLSSVAFPAQKVMLYESASWHFGDTVRYFADERAKVLTLSVDGAVRALATADTNRGWIPAQPAFGAATRFRYQPRLWEGPPPAAGEDLMYGHYRFTRGGPAGRDFGGPEIDTGQF